MVAVYSSSAVVDTSTIGGAAGTVVKLKDSMRSDRQTDIRHLASVAHSSSDIIPGQFLAGTISLSTYDIPLLLKRKFEKE